MTEGTTQPIQKSGHGHGNRSITLKNAEDFVYMLGPSASSMVSYESVGKPCDSRMAWPSAYSGERDRSNGMGGHDGAEYAPSGD